MTDEVEKYRIKFTEHNCHSGYVDGTFTKSDAEQMAQTANAIMPWRFKYTIEPVKEVRYVARNERAPR